MEKQNITLSIRKDILQKVKILAIQKNSSVSAMVSESLEDLVTKEEGYQAARRNHIKAMRESSSLGTYGSINWNRDSVHDR